MSSVSEQLRAIGLEPSTLTTRAEQEEARMRDAERRARALARAEHLERRAAREPLGSNARRKHLQTASTLRAAAAALAA